MAEKTTAFTEKMDTVVSNGYLSLSIAVGAQMGLFDVMATMNSPATAAEIAEKAGCKERFVREWLCAMSVDEIVSVSEDGERFQLPEEHKEGVTHPDHMVAAMGKFIPLLAQAHLPLVEAFKKDGPPGFDYSHPAPMLKEWEKGAAERMAATIPLLVEQIPGLQQKLESGISVCEVGSSRGHSLEWMGRTFPNSNFTGVEICPDTAKEAEDRFKTTGQANITMVTADAADMPSDLTAKFDLVLLIDCFHDIAFASRAAAEIYRVLAPGGAVSICDPLANSNPRDNIGHGMLNIIYPFSLYYCLGTSLNTPGSEGLGACAGQQKVTQILTDAGFKDVETKVIMEEQAHYIATKAL